MEKNNRSEAPDWHGCKTGDCPHEKQSECDAALAEYGNTHPDLCEVHGRIRCGECLELARLRTENERYRAALENIAENSASPLAVSVAKEALNG